MLLDATEGDVAGKPLFEDEAVAAQIAARPLPEVLQTVVWERGGAPLHFVVAHATLAVRATPEALRWLSLALALAAVAATYDLGRRLGGPLAGAVAAVTAGASGLLAVYATFGRMYSLLALAGALAATLFVRALHVRSPGSIALAAAAGWLLPASHPYGGIALAVGTAVALAAFRPWTLRHAFAVGALLLASVPFLVADARLAERFSVGGGETGPRLASREDAFEGLLAALRGFAGGSGPALVLALALAGVGLAVVARRDPPFAALAGAALLAPPVLATLVSVANNDTAFASPRHLLYALPAWAALIGVGAARIVRPLPPLLAVGAAAVAAGVLVAAPDEGGDPRFGIFWGVIGDRAELAEPAAWIEERVAPGDVLFPYAGVYLEAFPPAAGVLGLPRAQPATLAAAVGEAGYPAGALFVAVPTAQAPVDAAALRRALGAGHEVREFRTWLLVRFGGPLATPEDTLRRLRSVLGAAEAAVTDPPPDLVVYFRLAETSIEGALAR